MIFMLSLLLAGSLMPVMADPVKAPAQRREISSGRIDQYRNQRAFQYNQPPPKLNRGFWVSIREWIIDKIDSLLSHRGLSYLVDVLKWFIPALILVFAVVKMAGMDQIAFWRANSEGRTPVNDPLHADIHVLDFETSISEAVGKAHFREAIRLQYLLTLKQLTDRGYIRWQPGKTNADYVSEISSSHLEDGFASLTQVFEWAWYGEFPVSGDAYTKIEPGFRGFRERLAG